MVARDTNLSVYNKTVTDINSTDDGDPSTGILLQAFPVHTVFMLCLYCIIFLIGILGNLLVIYTVIRYKVMRTITNKFIACLSISDLLICFFAVPFTPLNALMTSWIFGEVLCRLVPTIQVISVFVSSLTSVAIALDRYMVIVHPHTPRMSTKTQTFILLTIWIMASLTAVPIGIYMKLQEKPNKDLSCFEDWPTNNSSEIYTWVIFFLQLVLPSIVIIICYAKVSAKLRQRTKARIGKRDYQREKMEACRNHRINRMLIAMISIFICCWLPLDLYHIDAITKLIPEKHDIHVDVFLVVHIIAMSSVIYNPFLYGWMNENFNRHFCETWKSITNICCTKTNMSSDGSLPTTVTATSPRKYTRDSPNGSLKTNTTVVRNSFSKSAAGAGEIEPLLKLQRNNQESKNVKVKIAGVNVNVSVAIPYEVHGSDCLIYMNGITGGDVCSEPVSPV